MSPLSNFFLGLAIAMAFWSILHTTFYRHRVIINSFSFGMAAMAMAAVLIAMYFNMP